MVKFCTELNSFLLKFVVGCPLLCHNIESVPYVEPTSAYAAGNSKVMQSSRIKYSFSFRGFTLHELLATTN